MSELRQQSQGIAVQQLQQILNRLIAAQPPLRVDGIFGPKTHARVVTFQTQARLTADGIVGPQTNRALVAGLFAATIRG